MNKCDNCEYGTLAHAAFNAPCEHYGCFDEDDIEMAEAWEDWLPGSGEPSPSSSAFWKAREEA